MRKNVLFMIVVLLVIFIAPNVLGQSYALVNFSMTGDSSPSPYVASANSISGVYNPYKAFDGIYNSAGGDNYWQNIAGKPAWIKIDLGAGNATATTRYDIDTYASTSYRPYNWTFEGSNDDSNYTVLDTRTTYVWSGVGAIDSFNFSNAVAYRYYKLNIVDYTHVSIVLIEELDLYSSDFGVANFSIAVIDSWDSTSLNNFSVTVNGSTYTTTTGTVTTNLLQNDSSTYSVFIHDAQDNGGYFNRTYSNYDVSTNLEGELHQSEIVFDAYEIFTGDELFGNFSVASFDYPVFNLSAGSYNVTFTNSSYYSKVFEFVVSAFDIETVNVTGVYDVVFNVDLKDIVTTDLIVNNSFIVLGNVSLNSSFNEVNGSFNINFLQGNYSLTAWADNYAFYYINISLNETVVNSTYYLYSNNSVWVTAKDSVTGNSLTNFEVELYDFNSSYPGGDNSTGVAKLEDIISGVYTLRVTKDDYSVAEYPITMTGGSHQNILAYMTPNATYVTFTVVNLISDSIIEGAQINIYKTINASWTLISSQDTDVTGRVRFSYTPEIEYKFVVDKTGYVQRTFLLQPIFSSYTLRLTPDTASAADLNTGDWLYLINNSGLFYNNLNNSFSIGLSSGTGTIEYYYLNMTNYGGNVTSVTCIVAFGCSDDFIFEIIGADFDDVVVVEMWVKESGRAETYFKKVYNVLDVYSPNSLYGWIDVPDADGFGALEKGLVGLLIVLVVVGFVSMGSLYVGAPPVTVSGVALAVTVEILAYVEFIPDMSAHLIALGVFLIVVLGRGEI